MLATVRDFARRLATMPSWPGRAAGSKRQYVLRGATLGLAISLMARLWMRTISEHRVFTVAGTLLIILFFTGMGALAGLVAWWRRNPQRPRTLFVRAAGVAPFLLLGPFTLFFVPSFVGALISGHPGWRKWKRRTGLALVVVFFALTELVLLTANVPGGPGLRVVSGVLYLPLAYALFVSNRLALDPLPPRGASPAAG